MHTPVVQRWRDRRGSYRPAGETIRTRDYEVTRCFAALRREGFAGVLALSDPATRTDAVGNIVFSGHIGNIYQASNARYLGRATRRTLHLLSDGLVLSARAIAKIRARDQGWRYSAKLLEAHGAAPLGESEDAAAWLRRWLPLLTRTFRHPGNHRYAFPLHKAVRVLGTSQPYPKFVAELP